MTSYMRGVTVASDSKQIVSEIYSGSNGVYGAIISEINNRALLFNYKFTFKGRAVNRDADRLAKFSNSLDQGRHIRLTQPHDPIVMPLHVEFE